MGFGQAITFVSRAGRLKALGAASANTHLDGYHLEKGRGLALWLGYGSPLGFWTKLFLSLTYLPMQLGSK